MTNGFYKPDGETFYYAPNYVYAPDYTLLKAECESYTYPINGWVWCDSIEQAIDILNIKLKEFESKQHYFETTDLDYPFIIINGEITKV